MTRGSRASTAALLATLALILSLTLSACGRASGTLGSGNQPLVFAAAQRIGQPDGNAAATFLRVGPDGRLYMTWTQSDADVIAAPTATTEGASDHQQHASPADLRTAFLASSSDGGRSWSTPARVNDRQEAVQGDENLPKIAVANNGRLYAVWSIPSEKGDKMRANVRFSRRDERGVFTPAVTLNELKDTARFPTVEVSPDGTVYVAWIDRRVDNPAPRRIYLTRISPTGTMLSSSDIGGPSCECCRVSMAFADGGNTMYIAYRQKTDQNIRDMVVQTSRDGGVTFSEPVLISDDGWYSEVCPHSGPVIATDVKGNLHVAWWTPGRQPEDAGIYYTVSNDGGRSFVPRRLIDTANGVAVLHANLALSGRGDVYLTWSNLVADKDQTQVFCRYLAADSAELSPVQQLSQAIGNALRPSLALSKDGVHVAWTETKDESSWTVLTAAPLPR